MNARAYCPSCAKPVRSLLPGPNGRPHARCPRCNALERHRFLALLLGTMAPRLQHVDTVVEIAPSRPTTRQLAKLPARRHLRFDIGYDSRAVDALASLTQLPLSDGCVDLLVCYHVLEHIPEDALAIAEIARVLSPEGFAVLQVPIRPGRPTDEDPSVVSDEERVARFGQADHVRYYGDDFESRLAAAGLQVERTTPLALLGGAAVKHFALVPDEFVWIATRGGRAPTRLNTDAQVTALTQALDHLIADNDDLRARLRDVRAKGRERQATIKRLRRRVTEAESRRAAPTRVGRLARRVRRTLQR